MRLKDSRNFETKRHKTAKEKMQPPVRVQELFHVEVEADGILGSPSLRILM